MSRETEDFKEFLREKRKKDEKLYRRSVQDLYDTLEGRDDELFSGRSSQGLLPEVETILRYYKLPQVAVSPNVPEEQRLQDVLERSGVMSRRIKLSGAWWKNDSMPLFCIGEDGEYHAVVPGKFGGRQIDWQKDKSKIWE